MYLGKFLLLSLVALMSSVSLASSTPCGKNEHGRSIQLVCVSRAKDNKTLISLRYHSGKKVYLKEVRSSRSGYGEQEYGQVVVTLTVVEADQNGEPLGRATSKVTLTTSWEYSAGGTRVEGETPSGVVFSAYVNATDE